MVRYLIIGIIVSIAEAIMALYDMKKLGLTMGDVWPNSNELNQVGRICVLIFVVITIAMLWPIQVYRWIKRIVSNIGVQETKTES